MKKRFLLIFIIFLSIFIILKIFSKKVVSGEKIKRQDYIEKLIVSGVVQGKENSIISSSIGGPIDKIFYKEGDFVKENDVLIKINDDELEKNIEKIRYQYEKSKINIIKNDTINLKNAETEYRSSQIDYEISKLEYSKYKKLYEKGFINILELNSKKNIFFNSEVRLQNALNNLKGIKNGVIKQSLIADMKSKENELEELEKFKEKHFLKAPYNLYILEKYVEVGERVSPYEDIFLVVSKGEKIAKIDLDEKYIGKVKKGDKVDIYPYGDISTLSTGEIYYIGIGVNRSNGIVELKSTIDNQLKNFLYNGSINAIISGVKKEDSFLINSSYIIEKGKEKFVYLYKNGKARLVEIKGIEVIDGFLVTNLKEEEIIVISPKDIKDGQKVKVKYKKDFNLKDFEKILKFGG